jgi:Resolvase, N terminal domain
MGPWQCPKPRLRLSRYSNIDICSIFEQSCLRFLEIRFSIRFIYRSLHSRMLQNANRAAQYLRVSTDMQQYSIDNQSEAIGLYAARRGLTIVRSYEDAGRSGRLEGRPALKSLIDDVKFGRADFKVILVYDVSRWGRFQNSDESAYYEFICKEAGVAVEYCAEEFKNDGSLTATVLKSIKRAMARRVQS